MLHKLENVKCPKKEEEEKKNVVVLGLPCKRQKYGLKIPYVLDNYSNGFTTCWWICCVTYLWMFPASSMTSGNKYFLLDFKNIMAYVCLPGDYLLAKQKRITLKFPPLHLIADTWETGSAFPRKCGIFCIFRRFFGKVLLHIQNKNLYHRFRQIHRLLAKSSFVLLTPVAYSSSPSPSPSSAFLSSSSPPEKIRVRIKKFVSNCFRLRIKLLGKYF